MEAAAIVLAAGAGTRMKSKKPKVAHEVLGKPLVKWVVDEARAAGANRIVSVVGHLREQVIPLVEDCTEIVVQERRLGTADAVASGRAALAGFDGSLLVLSGDHFTRGFPKTSCATLGFFDFIRVPAPAARTIAAASMRLLTSCFHQRKEV